MQPNEIQREIEISKHFLMSIRIERDRLMDRINQIDRLEVNEVKMMEREVDSDE